MDEDFEEPEQYPMSFPYGETLEKLENRHAFRCAYGGDPEDNPPLSAELAEKIRELLCRLRDGGYPEPDFFDWDEEGLCITWTEGMGELRSIDVHLNGTIRWMHHDERGWNEGVIALDKPGLGDFEKWEEEE